MQTNKFHVVVTGFTWIVALYSFITPVATFHSTSRWISLDHHSCRLLKASRCLRNPCKVPAASLVQASFRASGIPHVQTLSELKVREIWEGAPFTTARRVVEAVIQSTESHHRPFLLKKIPSSCKQTHDESPSGYEDLFDALYGCSYNPLASVGDVNAFKRDKKIKHFCLTIAYRGDDFCGWQTQPHNENKPSVQETLEAWITLLLNQGDTNRNSPITERANLRVSGRTDSGVHAIGQVSRLRTHRMDLAADNILRHMSDLPNSLRQSIRVTSVFEVSRSFHPTFTTTCRAYAYIMDTSSSTSSAGITTFGCSFWSEESNQAEKVAYLNGILKHLEGHEMDFIGFSYGKLKTRTSDCTLHHARARLVQVVEDDEDIKRTAICIELVGNRFLRRMVRLLVESSMRLVVDKFYLAEKSNQSFRPASAFGEDALLQQVLQHDRRVVSVAAPPDGLIFVGARIDTF